MKWQRLVVIILVLTLLAVTLVNLIGSRRLVVQGENGFLAMGIAQAAASTEGKSATQLHTYCACVIQESKLMGAIRFSSEGALWPHGLSNDEIVEKVVAITEGCERVAGL